MQGLHEEVRAFGVRKLAQTSQARQLAATQLICGFDLSAALKGDDESRGRYMQRLERMIERERLKGAGRHWSYDLNRHIALKQALDRLRELQPQRKSRQEAKKAPKVRTK